MLAFGARVVAYDPKPMEQARQLGVQYASLREVLESSDIVTLHAPACAQTHKMIGEAELAQMKPGALFINCARGALVDSQALCDALRSGHLAGAAVDVYDREPPLDDSEPLLHPDPAHRLCQRGKHAAPRADCIPKSLCLAGRRTDKSVLTL